MNAETTNSERILAETLNAFYGKDFVFSNTKFKKNKLEYEFTDNCLFLGAISFLFQQKDRDINKPYNLESWAKKKTKEAVKQLVLDNLILQKKDFLYGLKNNNNKVGDFLLKDINCGTFNIVTLNVNYDFYDSFYFEKSYISKTIDFVHVFSLYDIQLVLCFFLEPNDLVLYLIFRQCLLTNSGKANKHYSEVIIIIIYLIYQNQKNISFNDFVKSEFCKKTMEKYIGFTKLQQINKFLCVYEQIFYSRKREREKYMKIKLLKNSITSFFYSFVKNNEIKYPDYIGLVRLINKIKTPIEVYNLLADYFLRVEGVFLSKEKFFENIFSISQF